MNDFDPCNGLDAQQQHDKLMSRRLKKGLNLEGSKQRLEALLKAKTPPMLRKQRKRIMHISQH